MLHWLHWRKCARGNACPFILIFPSAGLAIFRNTRKTWDFDCGLINLCSHRAEGVAELRKAADGHFRAVAKVNGQNVGMLIDTGASIVLLSYEDAVAAGLNPQNLSFSMPVTTANGRSKVAPVTLDNVTIGNVGLDTVRAAVARPGAIHSSLLGMSFLGRLQETSFRRDKLILKN